jgi:hypothetical protein
VIKAVTIARLRDPFGKGGEFYVDGLFTRDFIPGYRQVAPLELGLWLAGFFETMNPGTFELRNPGTLEQFFYFCNSIFLK